MSDKPTVWLSSMPTDAMANPVRRQVIESLTGEFAIGNRLGRSETAPHEVQKEIFDTHNAFVFGPKPSFWDRYVASCFLACLTKNDASLANKPVVILNSDHSWDGFIKAVDASFKGAGVSKNAVADTITVVEKPEEVAPVIRHALANPLDLNARSSLHSTSIHPTTMEALRLRTDIPEPARKVVVFCSASLKANAENSAHLDADSYIASFKELGRKLAERGIGIVYGGGAHALMGALAEGAAEKNGWIEAVTLKRFFEREGLPNDQFSKVTFASDVHARVTDMFKSPGVSAFIIGPGSEGTLHEAETLNMLIDAKNPSMQTIGGKMKPTYLLALPKKQEGQHFWSHVVEHLGYGETFSVQPSVDALLSQMEKDNFAVPFPSSQKSVA